MFWHCHRLCPPCMSTRASVHVCVWCVRACVRVCVCVFACMRGGGGGGKLKTWFLRTGVPHTHLHSHVYVDLPRDGALRVLQPSQEPRPLLAAPAVPATGAQHALRLRHRRVLMLLLMLMLPLMKRSGTTPQEARMLVEPKLEGLRHVGPEDLGSAKDPL